VSSQAVGLTLGLTLAVLVAVLVATGVLIALVYRLGRWEPPPCALDDDVPRRPARALAALALQARECAALWRVIGAALLAPVARARPALAATGGDRRRPVILVAGAALPASSLRPLARALAAQGWSEVRMVRCGAGVEEGMGRLQAMIARVRTERTATVDVVAHGTGGIVSRACLLARGRASGIGRLITLGTAHQGTAFPLALGGASSAVRVGSPVLDRLAADRDAIEVADRLSIYSLDDPLVVPRDAAYWPGAFNIEIRGVGHLGLLVSPCVHELVVENLAAPREPAEAAAPPDGARLHSRR
jgi:hypothetical protein